jgi:glycerophosphoryl diester phosphodiesterase
MNKIILLILFSLVIISACRKDKIIIDNLNGNKISCLGHGGMGIGHTYPMNSFESISKSLNLGADGTEIDLQMTKDGVLVLFHDKELSISTDMSGLINDYNWNELKKARYSHFPYLNYSLISLEELFQQIENAKNHVFAFDCKLYPKGSEEDYYNSYISSLISLINKYKLNKHQVCIESQSIDFLEKFQMQNQDLQLFIYPRSFEEGLELALKHKLFGITISTRAVNKEQIATAHSHNLRIAIWNTHSANDNLEAIKKNPDYIQTDNLKKLLKLSR